jgi:hypothetical protein
MIAKGASMVFLGVLLFTTSCAFGGVFSEDQQGATRDQLLTLINDRGVDWTELPEDWEVMNIGRTTDEEVSFQLFVDRTVMVSGCVSLEAAEEVSCFGREIPRPFVLIEDDVQGLFVFSCPLGTSLCSERLLTTTPLV